MRLIDADALLEHIKTYCDGCEGCGGVLCRACEYGDAIDAIEDATTIDAVPRSEFEQLIRERDAAVKNGKALMATAQHAIKERDAAVADLHHVLMSVGYDCSLYGERICKYCVHDKEKPECRQDCNSRAEKWEWRGVQDEQND